MLDRLAAVAESHGFQLREGLKIPAPTPFIAPAPPARPPAPAVAQSSPQPPRRPPPPSPSAQHRNVPPPHPPPPHQYNPVSSQTTSGLFSSLKGGAGSLLKNLKVFNSLNALEAK